MGALFHGRHGVWLAGKVLVVVLVVGGLVALGAGGDAGFAALDALVDRVLGLVASAVLAFVALSFFILAAALVILPFTRKGPWWKRGWGWTPLGVVIFYFLVVAARQAAQ